MCFPAAHVAPACGRHALEVLPDAGPAEVEITVEASEAVGAVVQDLAHYGRQAVLSLEDDELMMDISLPSYIFNRVVSISTSPQNLRNSNLTISRAKFVIWAVGSVLRIVVQRGATYRSPRFVTFI